MRLMKFITRAFNRRKAEVTGEVFSIRIKTVPWSYADKFEIGDTYPAYFCQGNHIDGDVYEEDGYMIFQYNNSLKMYRAKYFFFADEVEAFSKGTPRKQTLKEWADKTQEPPEDSKFISDEAVTKLVRSQDYFKHLNGE